MNKVEKIKAEIERLKNELIQEAEKGHKSEFDEGRISAFEDMITFIDTLEVKKEVDLEKELDYDDYMNFFKEHPDYSNRDWGFDECWVFAEYFYKLGLKAKGG